VVGVARSRCLLCNCWIWASLFLWISRWLRRRLWACVCVEIWICAWDYARVGREFLIDNGFGGLRRWVGGWVVRMRKGLCCAIRSYCRCCWICCNQQLIELENSKCDVLEDLLVVVVVVVVTVVPGRCPS
jgi:hypothetical protein